jgi:hypothetical protein
MHFVAQAVFPKPQKTAALCIPLSHYLIITFFFKPFARTFYLIFVMPPESEPVSGNHRPALYL